MPVPDNANLNELIKTDPSDFVLPSVQLYLGIDPMSKEYEEVLGSIVKTCFTEAALINKAFSITGSEKLIVNRYHRWSDIGYREEYEGLMRDFVNLRCRLEFDPPQTGFTTTAIQKMLDRVTGYMNMIPEPEGRYK